METRNRLSIMSTAKVGKASKTITVPPAMPTPAAGPRARTYRLLIEHAMQLVRDGRVATVAEVAGAAGVARATAYRYFPTRGQLIAALVQESLGPVRSFESDLTDGRERIRDVFDQTFPRFKEFEPQLRAALQVALEHWALEKSGQLDEAPYRRGHRMQILARAAAPLRKVLGSRSFDRLLRALSVIYGIEAYVVLKDIWNADDREVEQTARWMVDALVDAALREAQDRSAAKPVVASRPVKARDGTAKAPAQGRPSSR